MHWAESRGSAPRWSTHHRFERCQVNSRVALFAIVVRHSKWRIGFDGNLATTTETLLNDGKESESTVFGAAKKKSTMKWAADGNSVAVTYGIVIDRGGQTMELKGTESWSLGTDGKTLVLQNAMSTPNGDISTKAVYDKQ